MKEWPEGNEVAVFSEIADPLKEAILFGYRLTRRAKKKDVPYDGYRAGVLNLDCMSPEAALKAESLKYIEENHGRDLLDEVIGIAIQLGMEQGRRMTMRQLNDKKYIITRAIGRETEKVLEEVFNGR
jgi:hypothetical protein